MLLKGYISASKWHTFVHLCILTGDFNLHVDDFTAPHVSSFLDMLNTFNLTQHITFPTHNSGHTLDLLITRSTSSLISSSDHIFTPISDHEFISSILSIPTNSRSPRITKVTRPINSINVTNFSNDILASSLYTSPAPTLALYLEQFTSIFSTLLDKHTPQKKD